MLQNMGGWSFVIILVVILLLFGAAKLPALAKSMGQSARVFKSEMKAMRDENGDSSKAENTADSTSPSTSSSTDSSPGSSDRSSS